MAKYLGLDLSTQSLSALIVDGDTGQILIDESINFGRKILMEILKQNNEK